MLICGIDIGKNNHEASIINETGRLLSKSFRFGNTTNGGEKLLAYFADNNKDNQVIVVGMEATGHYWMSLYCFLIAETIRIGRFSSTKLADEDILSMRQLCRHRMDLVDYISAQKRKIIGVMDRRCVLTHIFS